MCGDSHPPPHLVVYLIAFHFPDIRTGQHNDTSLVDSGV